jgi:ABC-2 type transport system permease protein
MTLVLVRKLLRDIWLPLLIAMLLLAAFQCLWAKSAQRVTTEVFPLFKALSSNAGSDIKTVQSQVFRGPAKLMQTMLGGEDVNFENPIDMLVIGFLHPLTQILLCLWAVYRAGSAIAGEIDRGTMELLLSQPMPRYKLVTAHLIVDLLTIPLICLAMWGGSALGVYLFGPFVFDPSKIPPPFGPAPGEVKLLESNVDQLGAGLWVVGGLLFALSGLTIWLSSRGRSRWTVIGIALALVIVMFALNLLGQMLDDVAVLRPLTIFYYYQPQRIVLKDVWNVDCSVWNEGKPLAHINMLAVLLGVGVVGYTGALLTFTRRDIPAPL